jgi:hypothetical protein
MLTPLEQFRLAMEDQGFSEAMIATNVRAVERFFKFTTTGTVDPPWSIGRDPMRQTLMTVDS